MAITLNLGSGGEILASEEISDEHYQLCKLISGEAASTAAIYSGNGVADYALRVTLASDSTGVVQLASGTNVVGTVNLGSATTAAGDLAKAEDAAHSSGDVGVMMLAVRKDTPANLSGTDGDYEPLQVSGGYLWTSAQGVAAHDASVSGNPVLIGGRASPIDGSDCGSVSEGDVSYIRTDLNGRVLVNTAHPNSWNNTDNQSSAQTNTALESAPGAGLSLYVTDVIFSADAAQTIKLVEDTAGTPVDVLEVVYLAADSSVCMHFTTPIKLTANKDLGYTSSAGVAHSVLVSGYTAP